MTRDEIMALSGRELDAAVARVKHCNGCGALLRRWVEWLPDSIWECRECGHIASPRPENLSEFTRTLLGDTLKELGQ